MVGKTIKSIAPPSADNISIDVAFLAKGIYLMEITSDSNSTVTKKLIIEMLISDAAEIRSALTGIQAEILIEDYF